MEISNLVEIHSHILPGIDDGSPDIETSLNMIEALKNQGCKAIVLTPHYYSDSISLDDFLDKRDRAFDTLLSAVDDDCPKLIPAAEVYISKYLFSNENLDRLTIANSGYILVEHPFNCNFSQKYYERLLNLNFDYGVKPILAHIERYEALLNDEDLLDEYIAAGCLSQVNIGSFYHAHRSVKKKLFKHLENGRVHLLGSDCHNLDSRPPEFSAGIKEIAKKSGVEAVEVLMRNANLLVK